MADRRKLQGEIERCFNKVSEGVEAFEDICEKVHNATNTNQKEKYAVDLKKEIKKLQRLRDQIKTWLTSNDIKDKKELQIARRVIEVQMEKFKIVEREMKTKAYSKEGLGAAPKMYPSQKETDDITFWLKDCIESLNIQIDKFESEMDSIHLCLKKKKNDKEKIDRLEEVKSRTDRHKYHIKQLETLLRMLDNGYVELDKIKKIKEDVEYYRDCSHEEDFQENEYIYDDFCFEDMDDFMVKQQQSSLSDAIVECENKKEDNSSNSQCTTTTTSHSPSPSPCFENHSFEGDLKPVDSPVKASSPSSFTPNNSVESPLTPVIEMPNTPNNVQHSTDDCEVTENVISSSTSKFSAWASSSSAEKENSSDSVPDINSNHYPFSNSEPVILDDAQSSLKFLSEKTVLNSSMSNHILHFAALQNLSSVADIDITQIFGVFRRNYYTENQKRALTILEAAREALPLPHDAQRYRYQSPGGPANTPDYYPSNVPNSHSIEFFSRLSTETLFFIFYFLQGTKAQYLAARALKTKSWRFHTMFMMWFQRHEEPKAITDDYEQGTYVYFDYEKWMQRKKEGFTFEYKYLEDKDLN